MKNRLVKCSLRELGVLALVLGGFITETAWSEIIPSDRRITWQGNVGIPGGVPNRTTIYQTLAAGATMSAIQTALNNCPSNQVVVLPAGTYTINGTLTIPTGKTLRGAGMGQTILSTTGSGTAAIVFGSSIDLGYSGASHNITSGYTKDATSVVLSSTSGISAGQLMLIDELNDSAVPVTPAGVGGSLSWGDRANGGRCMGQVVEVTGVSGSTVTFWNPLYWTYKSSLTPQALTANAGCQWAGLENLTIKANNTGYTCAFYMCGSKYCWVKGVECDFTDGDYAELYYCYRCEIRDSYFHDGFRHSSGTTDTDVMLAQKSSACLVENNVVWRAHITILLNWGAAGNVIAYNFFTNSYDSSSFGTGGNTIFAYGTATHGAHPMMNLWEGNCGHQFRPDSYWGSTSHGTCLRNWWQGQDYILGPDSVRGTVTGLKWSLQGRYAINLEYQVSSYNFVGDIVGCMKTVTDGGGKYMVVAPQARGYETPIEWTFGYGDVSDGGGDTAHESTMPYNTALMHGTYSFINNSQQWIATNADHNIPTSYYLASKPAWFGSLNWPPYDPANARVTASATNIPAGYRFTFGVDPPTSPGNAVVAVSPGSYNFGTVRTNSTQTVAFTVQNIGGGTLAGNASVPSAPFSIVSGGSYSLGAGASQVVTVRYAPTAAGSASQTVTFTGGGGASASVSGTAGAPPTPPFLYAPTPAK